MAAGRRGKVLMLKKSLIFIIILLVLSSTSYGKTDEEKYLPGLQKEYGRDLTHTPFFLRFSFQKEFNKLWKESNYPEREYFLLMYVKNIDEENKKEKDKAAAQAQYDKQRAIEKKELLIKQRNRLKAQLAKEKTEKLEDTQRQKSFIDVIKNQEEQLRQMEQELSQNR